MPLGSAEHRVACTVQPQGIQEWGQVYIYICSCRLVEYHARKNVTPGRFQTKSFFHRVTLDSMFHIYKN